MNWTIEQILAFVTAAEEGSFSAAGRALGRAQSVVSTHIATLEDTFGVELFDRSSRAPVLTKIGRDLLPEAQAMLRQSYRFESRALAEVKGEAMALHISLCHGVPFWGLSETIAALMRKYPYMTGSFQVKSVEEVWTDIKEGPSHMGLVLGDPSPKRGAYEYLCLGHVRYCVVASRDSPLAGLSKITIQDLSQHRQILSESDAKQYLLSSKYWLVDDILGAMFLAAQGIGWTVAPLELVLHVSRDEFMKNLIVLNPEKYTFPVRNINFIWNSLKFHRPDILEFVRQDLQKRYAQLEA